MSLREYFYQLLQLSVLAVEVRTVQTDRQTEGSPRMPPIVQGTTKIRRGRHSLSTL